ncbi:MAG: hypothetical protein IJJ82_00465 [Clostridia bacterium]|nr:hypothetical protein [Clostridia bacterium]
MFKFYYKITPEICEGEIKYRDKEYSFDFFPYRNSDIYILLNYITISIESSTMEAKYIWGCSPRTNWIEQKLAIPNYKKGKIILEKNDKIQSGMAYDYVSDIVKEYFDSEAQIYCIGDYKIDEEDTCIEFATNIIATIKPNNELKNIYVLLK